MLIIAMDNSFNDKIREENGKFYSSKRDALGIGLSSITSVAESASGSATFTSKGNVFKSSVYIRA